MDQKLEITALVLAGGKSVRMGRDKSRLRLGDKTLLERVLEAVAPLCGEVVLVTAKGQSLEGGASRSPVRAGAGLPPCRGPMGGLYTGLKASSHS